MDTKILSAVLNPEAFGQVLLDYGLGAAGARDLLLAHNAALIASIDELTQFCVCGCPDAEHELFEEGECCYNDDHLQCHRASAAVTSYATKLAARCAALETKVKAVADAQKAVDLAIARNARLDEYEQLVDVFNAATDACCEAKT